MLTPSAAAQYLFRHGESLANLVTLRFHEGIEPCGLFHGWPSGPLCSFSLAAVSRIPLREMPRPQPTIPHPAGRPHRPPRPRIPARRRPPRPMNSIPPNMLTLAHSPDELTASRWPSTSKWSEAACTLGL